jgi:hypothetical protein
MIFVVASGRDKMKLRRSQKKKGKLYINGVPFSCAISCTTVEK